MGTGQELSYGHSHGKAVLFPSAGSAALANVTPAGPCQDAIVPGGADHSVTMTVVGTVILSGTVDVR